ncbi:MAG: DUF4376 domain-containing protein [Hyphomicrobiaceae bacterium]|nr:MAG: DUF4376 domain-containing protein [Hyphomicrobiaceae bacterium]
MKRYWIEVYSDGTIAQSISLDSDTEPNTIRHGTTMVEVDTQVNPSDYFYKDGIVKYKGIQPAPGMTYDTELEQWVDPRPLSAFQAIQWNKIKMKRAAIEFGGFEWMDSVFDSDSVSQSRIQGAVLLASMAGDGFAIDWTLQDNTVITLSYNDLMEVAGALSQHVASTHAQARTLRTAIEAATTREDVEAIVWPSS